MRKRLTTLILWMLALCLLPLESMAQDSIGPKDTETAIDPQTEDAIATNTETENNELKDDEEDDKSWGISGSLGFDLGIGAFVKHEYARKVRSRFTLQLQAYYTIPVIEVDIHADTGFSQWLSKAGGTNGQYEFRWGDTNVGLSRNIWAYKSDPFSVSFDADLSFATPTSKASRVTNLYTTIMPSLSASFKLYKFKFAYSITYGHSFHKYTSSTMDPTEVDILSRRGGNELLGTHDIAIDGILTEIELVNQFSIGYQFIKQLGLGIGFGFADSWTYDTESNRYNDEYVGLHGKVGRGHSQYSMGSIALAYTPLKYLGFALSLVSTQPWKTKDQKDIRFPWFDFISPAKNYTKLMFSINAQY